MVFAEGRSFYPQETLLGSCEFLSGVPEVLVTRTIQNSTARVGRAVSLGGEQAGKAQAAGRVSNTWSPGSDGCPRGAHDLGDKPEASGHSATYTGPTGRDANPLGARTERHTRGLTFIGPRTRGTEKAARAEHICVRAAGAQQPCPRGPSLPFPSARGCPATVGATAGYSPLLSVGIWLWSSGMSYNRPERTGITQFSSCLKD